MPWGASAARSASSASTDPAVARAWRLLGASGDCRLGWVLVPVKMQPLRRAAAATATVARAAAAAEVRGELLPCRLLLSGDWPLSGDWLGRGSARERGSARGGWAQVRG